MCTFSFHGPEEVQVFKDRLPPADFEVIDLSPYRLPVADAPPPVPGSTPTGAGWLLDLCRPDLQCDVVVYSAEFAGSFFGASGKALSLADMEQASCRAPCAGLFHDAREVFLLGCNTLATKGQDTRSPAQYLEVLLDHGFDRAMAERVVAMRYGALGPSFRESLRRVFMGVPRLYGFDSVAPAGVHTAPLLERYFEKKGDYRRYLDQVDRSTAQNAELLTLFHGTGLVQTTGLMPDEPAAADRDRVCRIYDENRPVVARLRVLRELMARPDFLAFLPTLQLFVDRHPPEGMGDDERRVLDDIRGLEVPRQEILRLVDELDVSALQLELAHLAWHLGWLSPEAFRRLAVDGARELLHRRLTSEVVDVMCEIPRHASIGDEFRSDDLPESLFEDAEGIRLVDCVASGDKRVSARLADVLDGLDVPMRIWAGYALSRRLPLEDAILEKVADHLDDPSNEVRERMRWILETQAPRTKEVRRVIAAHDVQLADALRPKEERRRGFFW